MVDYLRQEPVGTTVAMELAAGLQRRVLQSGSQPGHGGDIGIIPCRSAGFSDPVRISGIALCLFPIACHTAGIVPGRRD